MIDFKNKVITQRGFYPLFLLEMLTFCFYGMKSFLNLKKYIYIMSRPYYRTIKIVKLNSKLF